MLLAILADTHGRVETTRRALDLLGSHRPALYIHCGDVGGEEILDLLAGLPAAFVLGNTDYDRSSLQRYARMIAVRCLGTLGELELDGRKLAITHGDDINLVKRLLAAQQHDYLLCGHTHVQRDQRQGRTRIINPGALHRCTVKSVATLDTSSDLLQFHPVEAA